MSSVRTSLWQSLLVACGVAIASRTSEWAFQTVAPNSLLMLKDVMGMCIAGVTAGLLFFLWRIQHRKSLLLVRERERAIRHVHHHLRNSLQVILYRSQDPVVRTQIERILREVEVALPSRPAQRGTDLAARPITPEAASPDEITTE
jgi:hypothetical protein